MVDVCDDGERPSMGQLIDGEVVGGFEAVIRRLLVFVGILGHDASQQLVQRVLDAFAVERGHGGA